MLLLRPTEQIPFMTSGAMRGVFHNCCLRSAARCRGFASTSIVRTAGGEAATKTKPSIANIAELRKILPGTSMIKAREALTAAANDVQKALSWLENDSQVAGAKKATKLGSREAKEGAIACCVVTDGAPSSSTDQRSTPITLAARASIVELNCETDFVGRNEIFQQLLADIAHTAALFPNLAMDESKPNGSSTESNRTQELVDLPVEQLLEFPLIPRPATQADSSGSAAYSASPKTVGAAIIDVITRLGERVHLARASALSNAAVPSPLAPRRSQSDGLEAPWNVSSSFTHGGSSSSQAGMPQISSGRVGALLLTRVQSSKSRRDDSSLKSMRGLTRSLARQAAGMPTRTIEAQDAAADQETALYGQPFIMRLPASQLADAHPTTAVSEQSVSQALEEWGSAWSGESNTTDAVRVVAMRRWQLGE